jgi:hypothetical protein
MRSEEMCFEVFLVRNNNVIIAIGIRPVHRTFSQTNHFGYPTASSSIRIQQFMYCVRNELKVSNCLTFGLGCYF